MTILAHSWRSLNLLKGSRFHHPKKVTKNCQEYWLECFNKRSPLGEKQIGDVEVYKVGPGKPLISYGAPTWRIMQLSKWLAKGVISAIYN